MKKFNLLIFSLILMAGCNMPKLKKIESTPNLTNVIERYKNQLGAETLRANTGWFQIDTNVSYRINVLIFNPNNMPESKTGQKELTRNIAKDIAKEVTNINEFDLINVKVQNKSGTVVSVSSAKTYQFTIEELTD